MSSEFNPRYTFETFVIGDGNRVAVTAAHAVAEEPGSVHNPLFLHSGTGLGKTHLLMAVGHETLSVDPNRVVHYLTLDDFVEAYRAAASQQLLESFRERYLTSDLVLIDDVQFVARRPEVQDELLRFVADLADSGVQVVLTSDQPPPELSELDDRMLQKIDGGLVVDIAPPDFDNRLAILRQRAYERGAELGAELLAMIAERDAENVRELLGNLNRIIAFQTVSDVPLTLAAGRAVLSGGDADEALALSRSSGVFGSADEFGAFLSGVTAAVTEQVDVWQQNLRDVVDRWSRRGYNTARLERALDGGVAAEAADAVSRYEDAVTELLTLQAAVAECNPERAGDPVFRDPERVEEARLVVERAQEDFEPPPGPSKSFSIDTFLRSRSTKMALSAAESVLAAPGTQYNPLVIIGPSGVGKTHLLHGIGRGLELPDRGWIACTSAQVFMDELVTAIDENRVPSWRARYRRASAFLLDNIDLIGGQDRIQEEIFFLFNVLLESERQLVFTSSRRPREIRGLDDRLVSRLEGGLLATLKPPDYELRKMVLTRQFEERITDAVEEAVVDYLADQRAESVRSVLALGQRVITSADARGQTPTLESAKDVVGATALRESAAVARGRPSGVVMSPSGGIETAEKVVWKWPDPVDYIIGEMG